MTHNFKVGERVRFLTKEEIACYRPSSWNNSLDEYFGKEVIVISVCRMCPDCLIVRGNGIDGHYSSTNLVPVEEFQEGEIVLVSDDEESDWGKGIYLCTIPGNTTNKYIIVREGDEENYKEGETFDWVMYEFIKKLPQVKEVTMEEVEEKFGCKVKIINQ